MATASEIADRALALASGFIEESREQLAAMAGGEAQRLYDAAQAVRNRETAGPHLAHSPEHLAFSLITAAHELLRERARGS